MPENQKPVGILEDLGFVVGRISSGPIRHAMHTATRFRPGSPRICAPYLPFSFFLLPWNRVPIEPTGLVNLAATKTFS